MSETKTQGRTPAKVAADLYKDITASLVEHQDAVVVKAMDTATTVMISATVHHEDHGQLIGAAGATYSAMLVILTCACSRMGRNLVFQQVKPAGPKNQRRRFPDGSGWDSAVLAGLARRVCAAMFAYEAEVATEDMDKTTMLRIGIHDAEPVENDRELALAMEVVFRAVGAAGGRVVVCDLTRRSA